MSNLSKKPAACELTVCIRNQELSVILKSCNKSLDTVHWRDRRNLSQKLLGSIDKLLSRHGLKPEQISKVRVDSNLGEAYTSNRIANTVARAMEWSNNM